MPLKPHLPSAAPPTKPHLVLMMSETEGQAIPPGARLIIVEDARDMSRQWPMILKSVAHNKLVFTLGNTDYEFRLTSGKPLTKEAIKRMKEARGE